MTQDGLYLGQSPEYWQQVDLCEVKVIAQLKNQAIIHDLMTLLKPDDFLNPQYRRLWEAAKDILQAGNTVNFSTLFERLGNNSLMQDYMALEKVEYGSNRTALDHARVVKSNSTKRILAKEFIRAGEDIFRVKGNADTAVNQIMASLLATLKGDKRKLATQSSYDAILDMDTHNLAVSQGKLPPALKTGFLRLDSMIQIRPTNVFVIAGRSNLGKTTFATQVACDVLRQGKRVLWISSEMSHPEMACKFLAVLNDVNPAQFTRNPALNLNQSEYVREYESELKRLIQMFKPGGTEIEIEQILSMEVAKAPIDLLVVDYIQRLTWSGWNKNTNDAGSLSKISGHIKRLAGEYQVPVILISQMPNPSPEERKPDFEPELWHLKGSGDIGNDADIVMFIHKIGSDAPGAQPFTFFLRKVKHGQRGDIKAKFDYGLAQFRECDWRTESE